MSLISNAAGASMAERSDEQVKASRSIKRISLIAICAVVFIASFAFSLYILDIYTAGDQVFYKRMYYALADANIDRVLDIQRANTGSSDVLFGYLFWLGAQFFQKNIYISFFKATLCTQLFVFLKQNKTPYIIYPLFFTNFYLIVLLTSAERLKFSMVFLLFFLLIKNRSRYIFAIASPLTHSQNIIVYASALFKDYSNSLFNVFKTGRINLKQIFVLSTFSLSIIYITLSSLDTIVAKFSVYQVFGINDMIPMLLLATAAIFVSKRKMESFLALVPIIIGAYLLGGDRMNMIGFMIFAFLITKERRTFHPVFLIIMAYFSYKSVGYLDGTFRYGDGFVGLHGFNVE
jgi:hypothetical protein